MQAEVVLDCRGMKCPRPIVEMAKRMRKMQPGQVLELQADDPVAKVDVPRWCDTTGNEFVGREDVGDLLKFYVTKTV